MNKPTVEKILNMNYNLEEICVKNANKTTALLRESVVFDASMIDRVTFDGKHQMKQATM